KFGKVMKNYQIIILILTIIFLDIKAQNSVYVNNNDVISYCYQPLISSLGLARINAINADGTNNRLILNASIGLCHQDWSPDTMKFAVVGYVDGGGTTWSIYTFNSNGTNFVRLTTTNNVWDSEPVWSSDMSKISFSRVYPNQNMKRELWLMNSDGSDQHYIGVEGWFARWSKDGAKFVYCSNKNNNNFDIYVCDTNGSNEQRLTNTAIDEMCPFYSPDGTEIAYTAGSSTNLNICEIYKMKSNGTNVRQLTNNNSFDYYPRWSPDGTMFAFVSDRHETDRHEIYIMDTSGANVQRVTYSPANVTAVNPVWRQGQTTPVKNINNIVPEECKLFQNYPNPFNPSTKIKFQIKEEGFVTLKVYDILGKEIATLVNDNLKAGEFEVSFSNNKLPNGVNFYKLETEKFQDTKRMLLIK
ncbi:MAG: T9SS type A sorting domain-containing protein, partial [Ignavibacteriae bacterium]|nr:T9SS type A sorting domain-containing protein [Ignavibacteriota bacterium]